MNGDEHQDHQEQLYLQDFASYVGDYFYEPLLSLDRKHWDLLQNWVRRCCTESKPEVKCSVCTWGVGVITGFIPQWLLGLYDYRKL